MHFNFISKTPCVGPTSLMRQLYTVPFKHASFAISNATRDLHSWAYAHIVSNFQAWFAPDAWKMDFHLGAPLPKLAIATGIR